MNKPEQPKLTVIICTYNRADLLRDCLNSLKRQTIPKDTFNTLVVENNSTDGTHELVTNFADEMSYLNIVVEPQQGLSFARNRGLENAQTEWVAYLDDDAKAHSDWVERIYYIIEHYEFDAFGGVYLPWYREGKVDWYLDEYGTNRTWMPYDIVTRLDTACFSGGNAVYRREAALAAGGFPADLGMQGENLGYREENVLQKQMRERGYVLGFDPKMIIDHLVPLQKQQLSWFRERKIAEGRSYLREQRYCATPVSIAQLLLSFLAIDLRSLAQASWKWLRGSYRMENMYVAILPPLLYQREVFRQLLKQWYRHS
jgi:glycosyltransferase involved in cell wall biosynthesis